MWTILSGLLSKRLNIIIYIGLFVAGGYSAKLYYDGKIAEILNSHNDVILKIQNDTIAELQQRESTIADLISERDEYKAKINDITNQLSASNGRVQYLISQQSTADNSTNANNTNNNSTVTNNIPLQRCRNSLERSKALIGRYSDLVTRLSKFGLNESIDKDSLVKYITIKSETNKTKDAE